MIAALHHSSYQQVYRLEMDTPGSEAEPRPSKFSLSTAAAKLRWTFPEAAQVARLALSSQWVDDMGGDGNSIGDIIRGVGKR